MNETPATIANRPGLSEIAYRVGTWAQFKASMLATLSRPPDLPATLEQEAQPSPLWALKTRDDGDFTIALCDAFAVVCDILTFYYERSANEHYLRTATQLASIAELAALIGYEPGPGVAASAALAFTLEAQPPTFPSIPQPPQPALVPTQIPLPAGLQIQSVPSSGQQPVTFETVAPISARYAWNALSPRLTSPYKSTNANCYPTHLRLAGLIGTIAVGDFVLIGVNGDEWGQGINRVALVQQDTATQTTLLTFENPSSLVGVPSSVTPTVQGPPTSSPSTLSGLLNSSTINNQVVDQTWSDQTDFVAQAQKLQWDIGETEALINAVKAQPPSTPPFQVFKLGVHASVFGHNAPAYSTLPASLTQPPPTSSQLSDVAPSGGVKLDTVTLGGTPQAVFPTDWDTSNVSITDMLWLSTTSNATIVPLDSTYPALVCGTWVVLVSNDPADPNDPNDSSNAVVFAQIITTSVTTIAYYLLSSTVTQLCLNVVPSESDLGSFTIRNTLVLGATDSFTPAEEFFVDYYNNQWTIGGSVITLDSAHLGLAVGQELILTGTSSTKTGSVVNELHTIAGLALVDGRTQVTLDSALSDTYVWNSVTINANVAPATHGASKSQILGSGDASKAYQRFALNQLPVTYVSAATPSTTASTLQVRVNGELWTEVPYLYGQAPTARVYVTSVDQNGNRFVEFGDGAQNGARLPTGSNNVIAYYRQGLGSTGNLAAKQLSTLLTRPLGIRSVINPLPATGGGDPQIPADARATAPVTVRALQRIVSLDDYGDFASASAAVAKAAAVWAWNGLRNVVCITVAGPGGAGILPGTSTYQNLLSAIGDASEGTIPVALCSFVQRTFTVGATLTVDPAYDADQVVINAKVALQAAFSFSVRAFMQPVYRSEVIATLQSVAGVVALTLDTLRYNDNLVEPSQLSQDGLTAAPPSVVAGVLSGAELLTIDKGPLPSVVHA